MRHNKFSLSYLPPKELEIEVEKMISNPTLYSKENFIDALLLLSMNNINFKLADHLTSFCIHSRSKSVKNMAVMAVGHIARVYKRKINQALYCKIVEICLQDKDLFLQEGAYDALCDLRMFLKIPLPNGCINKNPM